MKLKEVRKKKGISQKELADALGVSRSLVAMWETGRSSLNASDAKKIAEFFDVSLDYLIGESDSEKSSGVWIPVLGDIAAGIPIEAIQEVLGWEEIDVCEEESKEYFGLRIKGDSMSPRMKTGDVVIVRKQQSADTGDVVAALVNGDSATVKVLKKENDGIMLVPYNNTYSPMYYSNKEIESLPVIILGKVVELRAKF